VYREIIVDVLAAERAIRGEGEEQREKERRAGGRAGGGRKTQISFSLMSLAAVQLA
jgi:hypothetical protein